MPAAGGLARLPKAPDLSAAHANDCRPSTEDWLAAIDREGVGVGQGMGVVRPTRVFDLGACDGINRPKEPQPEEERDQGDDDKARADADGAPS